MAKTEAKEKFSYEQPLITFCALTNKDVITASDAWVQDRAWVSGEELIGGNS